MKNSCFQGNLPKRGRRNYWKKKEEELGIQCLEIYEILEKTFKKVC